MQVAMHVRKAHIVRDQGHWPIASEELRFPANSYVSMPPGMWIVQLQSSLQVIVALAAILTANSLKILSQNPWLSLLDSWSTRDCEIINVCGFKLLNLGAGGNSRLVIQRERHFMLFSVLHSPHYHHGQAISTFLSQFPLIENSNKILYSMPDTYMPSRLAQNKCSIHCSCRNISCVASPGEFLSVGFRCPSLSHEIPTSNLS